MTKKIKALVFLSAILLVIAAALLVLDHAWADNPFHSYNQRKITIGNSQINVWLADTPVRANLGLGGVAKLNDNQGMLFLFDKPGVYPFWMKGMKMPIDIIWLKDNIIVSINYNVPAEPGVPDDQLQRYSPGQEIDSVLEVRANWAKDHGVQVGSKVNDTH